MHHPDTRRARRLLLGHHVLSGFEHYSAADIVGESSNNFDHNQITAAGRESPPRSIK